MDLLKAFPPQRQGLFLWLLELMADVSASKATNKMSEQNIAIVIAPNLYGMSGPSLVGGDPMAAVKAMASFVEKLLIYYVAVRSRIKTQRQDSAVVPSRNDSAVAVTPSMPPPPPPAVPATVPPAVPAVTAEVRQSEYAESSGGSAGHSERGSQVLPS